MLNCVYTHPDVRRTLLLWAENAVQYERPADPG